MDTTNDIDPDIARSTDTTDRRLANALLQSNTLDEEEDYLSAGGASSCELASFPVASQGTNCSGGSLEAAAGEHHASGGPGVQNELRSGNTTVSAPLHDKENHVKTKEKIGRSKIAGSCTNTWTESTSSKGETTVDTTTSTSEPQRSLAEDQTIPAFLGSAREKLTTPDPMVNKHSTSTVSTTPPSWPRGSEKMTSAPAFLASGGGGGSDTVEPVHKPLPVGTTPPHNSPAQLPEKYQQGGSAPSTSNTTSIALGGSATSSTDTSSTANGGGGSNGVAALGGTAAKSNNSKTTSAGSYAPSSTANGTTTRFTSQLQYGGGASPEEQEVGIVADDEEPPPPPPQEDGDTSGFSPVSRRLSGDVSTNGDQRSGAAAFPGDVDRQNAAPATASVVPSADTVGGEHQPIDAPGLPGAADILTTDMGVLEEDIDAEERQRRAGWEALGAEVNPEWLNGFYNLGALHHDPVGGEDFHEDGLEGGQGESVPLHFPDESQEEEADGEVESSAEASDEAAGGEPGSQVSGNKKSETRTGTGKPKRPPGSGLKSARSLEHQRSSGGDTQTEEEKKWTKDAIQFIDAHMTTDLKIEDVQEKVIKPLQKIADEIGLKGEMKCFGSFMSGFASKRSDLDVTFIQKDSTVYIHDVLNRIATKLEASGLYDSITKVLHAQSPLVRCTHLELAVEVEILMNNQLGVENSNLLHCYSKLDPKVAQLVRLVKTWAKNHDILGSQDGCINSYAYVLLVLYYLVCINFLPNLQLLAQALGLPRALVSVKKWGSLDTVDTRFWQTELPSNYRPASASNCTLYNLAKGFFEFYTKFPWETSAVCLRYQIPNGPTTSTAKTSLFYRDAAPPSWYVEDPFDVKHNLAGRTTESGRRRITNAMQAVLKNFDAFDEAFQTQKPPRYWLKASISSTVTPKQVLDIFKEVKLLRMYFPKYATFFQEDPNKMQHIYGAPRYKNIMCEFSSQAELRQAEMRNEVFLCESQLRLHKTTTGFVEDEVKSDGYYEFDLLKPDLEEMVAKAEKERSSNIAARSTGESPKYKGDTKGSSAASSSSTAGARSAGAAADSSATPAYNYHLSLTLPPSDLGGTEEAKDGWARSNNASKENPYPGYPGYTGIYDQFPQKAGTGASPSLDRKAKEAADATWADWYRTQAGAKAGERVTPEDATPLKASGAVYAPGTSRFDYASYATDAAAAAYGKNASTPGGASSSGVVGTPKGGYVLMQPRPPWDQMFSEHMMAGIPLDSKGAAHMAYLSNLKGLKGAGQIPKEYSPEHASMLAAMKGSSPSVQGAPQASLLAQAHAAAHGVSTPGAAHGANLSTAAAYSQAAAALSQHQQQQAAAAAASASTPGSSSGGKGGTGGNGGNSARDVLSSRENTDHESPDKVTAAKAAYEQSVHAQYAAAAKGMYKGKMPVYPGMSFIYQAALPPGTAASAKGKDPSVFHHQLHLNMMASKGQSYDHYVTELMRTKGLPPQVYYPHPGVPGTASAPDPRMIMALKGAGLNGQTAAAYPYAAGVQGGGVVTKGKGPIGKPGGPVRGGGY
ncbi:unnamed protein product [Amoebophrya sp. A25]|nr:unnamed protein product [Amoebophrya sp. A25]|eukprot:GSA25T00017540001.1